MTSKPSLNTRRRAAAWMIAGLAAAALCSMSLAADPVPARPAETISWTWTTVQAAPGQPRGYTEFTRACAVCHGDGPAKPGTRALHTKYHDKEPALLAERTDLAPDYIKYVVRHGVSVMPPFRKTELSDAELEELVAYLTRKRH